MDEEDYEEHEQKADDAEQAQTDPRDEHAVVARGPHTHVWLERLTRLLELPTDHPGAAERIQIYTDRIEQETGGYRPATSAEARLLAAQLREVK